MKREDLRQITELRHTLHAYPELSGRESGTIARLTAFLRGNTSFTVVEQDGWFYAYREGASSASPVAFRADMDALPMEESISLPYASVSEGTAHKCGHDGHMAALCGLALALERTELPRTVYLIFQPAEEIGTGALLCRGLIREKNISEIYAFHNLSGYPENSVLCRHGLTQPASEGLTIRFAGKQSHASAPEDGFNPGPAIAELVLYAKEQFPAVSASEESVPEDLILCTLVGMRCGGEDFGISAGEGSVSFTLRAGRESAMKDMEKKLLARAEELASEGHLTLSHALRDCFPETVNHGPAADRVLMQAGKLGFATVPMRSVWRASEDFGYFLKECPGAMFYIGNGEDYPPVHTAEYDFNDRILKTAVGLFRAIALDSPAG